MNRHERRLAKKQGRTIGSESSAVQGLLVEAVQHHQAGRLAEAEKLYKQILDIDAHHADSLHLLGVIAFQYNRAQDSLDLIGRAIKINDRAPHYHNNFGNTLRMLGRPEEAVSHYCRSLALKPDYAEAHNNLGIAYFDLKRFDDAEAAYERALALIPNYIDAIINLGNVCIKRGRIDEAFAHYQRAVSLAPENMTARYYATTASLLLAPVSAWEGPCKDFLSIAPSTHLQKIDVQTRLAIHYWVQGDFIRLFDVLKTCSLLSDEIGVCRDVNVINARSYADFLSKLYSHYSRHISHSITATEPHIALIGDSHCLTYAHTTVTIGGVEHRVSPHLIVGCKAWHLAQKISSEFTRLFDAALGRLAPATTCFLVFGEIDCRYNEGILKHIKKHGGDLRSITEACVRPYAQNTVAALRQRGCDVSFLNVPAPSIEFLLAKGDGFTPDDPAPLIDVIRMFNEILADEAFRLGCNIIDIYSHTVAPDGNALPGRHIDGTHLKPEALSLAMHSRNG